MPASRRWRGNLVSNCWRNFGRLSVVVVGVGVDWAAQQELFVGVEASSRALAGVHEVVHAATSHVLSNFRNLILFRRAFHRLCKRTPASPLAGAAVGVAVAPPL